MGIKNLNKIIGEVYTTGVSISSLGITTVYIDALGYMYRYKAVSGQRFSHLMRQMLVSLINYEINVVMVFDGSSPPEKIDTRKSRVDKRDKQKSKSGAVRTAIENYQNSTASDEEIQLLQTLTASETGENERLLITQLIPEENVIDLRKCAKKLDRMDNNSVEISAQDTEMVHCICEEFGIECITSAGEAEKDCVELSVKMPNSAVISADTDVLAYNIPEVLVISKYTSSGVSTVIRKSEVLTHLGLTVEQFTDLCILLGTDYNTTIPKVGVKTALKYILKYKSIEEICTSVNLNPENLKFIRCRELFDISGL